MATYDRMQDFGREVLACVITGLSCLFLIIGLACPGWVIFHLGTDSYYIGLFVVKFCINGGCKTMSVIDMDTTSTAYGAQDKMTGYQFWAIAGLVSGILGAVLLGLAVWQRVKKLKQQRLFAGLSSLFLAISGGATFIPVGAVGVMYADLSDLSAIGDDTSIGIKTPYALILSAIGAFGILVAALFALIIACSMPTYTTAALVFAPIVAPGPTVTVVQTNPVPNMPYIGFQQPGPNIQMQPQQYAPMGTGQPGVAPRYAQGMPQQDAVYGYDQTQKTHFQPPPYTTQ